MRGCTVPLKGSSWKLGFGVREGALMERGTMQMYMTSLDNCGFWRFSTAWTDLQSSRFGKKCQTSIQLTHFQLYIQIL